MIYSVLYFLYTKAGILSYAADPAALANMAAYKIFHVLEKTKKI